MAVQVRTKGAYSVGAALPSLGAWLVVFTFVAAQFVEFTLFEIGDFDVSFQKVGGLICFPIAFVLMGHVRISVPLILLGVALITANSAAYIVRSDFFSPKLLSANLTVLAGFVGATMLYTALVQSGESFSLLGRMWVGFAVVTSIFVCLQAAGVLPLWAVSGGDLEARVAEGGEVYRGTGLKFDPNYQALVLVLGIIFAQFYLNKFRTLMVLLILLGVLATFSRMGLLVAALIWIVASLVRGFLNRREKGARLLKLLGVALGLTFIAAAVYVWAPQEAQLYLGERLGEVAGAYRSFTAGGVGIPSSGLNSAETRILLFEASWKVLAQHYVWGVGAYSIPAQIYYFTGLEQTVHNTYLEALLTGGIWGGFVIALYLILLLRVLIGGRPTEEDKDRKGFILTLLLAFGLMALFLDLNHNSILWLPLVVALAYSRLSKTSSIYPPIG